jgi:two-component system, NarL family, response regulator NreC
LSNTVRILLADDHDVVLRGLHDVLARAHDLEVVGEARDGATALRLARSLRPDVAVLDVSMPGMDGVETATQITQHCPGTAILALTMHDDRGHLARMMKAGAAGYVLKRSAAGELVTAIREVAAGRTWVDPVLGGYVLSRRAGTLSAQPSPDILSEREEQVLRAVAWGHSNKEIAGQLGVSTKTVETYKARIADKLGLRSRTEMVRFALQQGWLSPE